MNENGRDFAVGDVHGHFAILRSSLRAIGFDVRCDRLFSVGDLVDRGPESAQALRWLQQPWFHAIRGNHEDLICDALRSDDALGAWEEVTGETWWADMPEPERQQLAARLLQLPIGMQVQTRQGMVGLVHADLPCEDWPTFVHLLQSGQLLPRDREHCLWSIARHARRHAQPVTGVRAVVHGHITVPTMQVLGNVHFIDTHHSLRPAGEQGHFTFLELATLQAHEGPGGNWVKASAVMPRT